jgi:hypothetical protein
VKRLEPFPDGGIEGGVFCEPTALSGLAPEGDDVLRLNGA